LDKRKFEEGNEVYIFRNLLFGTTSANPTTPNDGPNPAVLQQAFEFLWGHSDFIFEDINTTSVLGQTTILEAFMGKIRSTIPVVTTEIYISSQLKDYFGVSHIFQPGKAFSTDKGKAILADIRYSGRSIPFGLYIGSSYDQTIPKDNLILTMSKGLYQIPEVNYIKSPFRFEVGKVYYLGENGQLTCTPEKDIPYTTTLIKIGTAQTPERLLVGIEEIDQDFKLGEFPIGYTKPSLNGQVEFGYLLADGLTEYSEEAYPELFKYLKQFFTDTELNVNEKP
jgi:hypothetical protein